MVTLSGGTLVLRSHHYGSADAIVMQPLHSACYNMELLRHTMLHRSPLRELAMPLEQRDNQRCM